MSAKQPLRLDDALRDRLSELTGGAADLCYQCGVCTAVCPWGAFGEGGPNIRLLIRDAQLGLEPDDGGQEALWRCTTCGACEALCPRGVRVTDAIVGLRALAFERRRAPQRLEEVLWSLYENGNPDGFPPSQRMAWAEELELPAMGPERSCLVYFGSAVCYDARLQRVARALVYVLRAAEVDFGVLEDEPDSGDLVRLIGERAYLEELIASNVEALDSARVREIVVVSPHDYDAFRRHYARHGGSYRVFHVTEYLARLLEYGRLAFAVEEPRQALYHDPCYLGRHHGVYDPPRRVLEAMEGLEVLEFSDNRADALCCGGGGGRMWLETAPGERFSDLRVREAVERGVDLIVTACPYCIQMLEDSVRSLRIEGVQVRDVVELAAAWWPHAPREDRRVLLETRGRRRAE